MGVGDSKKLATSLAIFVTLLFSLMTGAVAHAQVTGATVSGTVSDPSGGVVAGAIVSTTNTATAVTREATADSAGLYTIPNLLPGSTTSRSPQQAFLLLCNRASPSALDSNYSSTSR